MKKNSIIITILVIILVILATLLIMTKVGSKDEHTKAEFLKNVIDIQAKLSYYVGNTYSETFGIYNKDEIILGVTPKKENTNENKKETKITKEENSKEEITPLANKEKKKEENSKVCYEALPKNFSKILKVTLPEYEGITWYIQDGQYLRVEGSPSWWTSDLDCLKIGK
ncbi:MAG: hypothetical protein RSB67_01440 [Clostridia bacterium]